MIRSLTLSLAVGLLSCTAAAQQFQSDQSRQAQNFIDGIFGATDFAIADIDGDGRSDYVVVLPGLSGVRVVRNLATGRETQTVNPFLFPTQGVQLVDLDGGSGSGSDCCAATA